MATESKYIFEVPNVGTMRVSAADLNQALMEVADQAGITLKSVVQQPKPKLRLVYQHGQIVQP